MFRRLPQFLMFSIASVFVCLHANAEEGSIEIEYVFTAQEACNSPDQNMCFGLASCIECLEEGTEKEGMESSSSLAARIWCELSDPKQDREFEYFREIQLHDDLLPIRSKAALEEVGSLIQEKYEDMVKVRIWQEKVVSCDPHTPEGRLLLKMRERYLDLVKNQQENTISNEDELKSIFSKDKDGLIALVGFGLRKFENGPPQNVINRLSLKIDAGTAKYPSVVPSAHVFLLLYNREVDKYYVYDSDDPDEKWLVHFKNDGKLFKFAWRIKDNMGGGPSHQMYYDVRPMDEFMSDIIKLDGANKGRVLSSNSAGACPVK